MKGSIFSILINWKWIISLSLLIFPFCISAQIVQPVRYEVELDNEEESFTVAPNPDGLLLFKKESGKSIQGFIEWEFIKLNENLEEQWRQKYLFDPSLFYHQHKIHESHLFILLGSRNSFNYKVVFLNSNTGHLAFYDIISHLPILINSFEITDEGILIGGSYNLRPVVLLYYFKLNRSVVLPNLYSLEGELDQISPGEDTFDVVVSRSIKKNTVIHLYTFNYEGQMLENEMLFPKGKLSLQQGKIVRDGKVKLIIGTYGHRQSAYSRGLYVANLNSERREVRYYNYGDLNNFFNYLKEKKTNRIKKRISKKKEAGKKIKFNYRLMINDIINKNGEYVVLGEAFYPKYKSNSYYSPSSQMHIYNYSRYDPVILDSYRYTHAVLVGFDKFGNLLWDNCFEINDVENKNLSQVVQVKPDKDELFLCYNYNSQISTKVIRQNQVVKRKDLVPISLKYQKDLLRKNVYKDKSGIIKGENNSFYAYGIQRIKNMEDENAKLNREVFFINRVIYK